MIVEELRATRGSLAKASLLAHATPQDLKLFRYTYDKNYTYGVKFGAGALLPLKPPSEADFALLDKLRTRELSGRVAEEAVLTHCAAVGSHLVKLVCNKSLDCGVTATSINKVCPATVPVFKVQLAKEIDISKVEFPCYAELKYDGVRLIVLKQDGEVTFTTRNGKIVSLPKLSQTISACSVESFMLDTEVTLASGKMEDRTSVSGMINSAMKGGSILEHLLVLNVFDGMATSEFLAGSTTEVYGQRRAFADVVTTTIASSQVVLAERTLCETAVDVNALYSTSILSGYEGLILKAPNSPYLFKRSADWAKMKETKTADLVCHDWIEGTGQFEGCIGALVCKGEVEGKVVTVHVGSGLTVADRTADVWRFLGKTIEINYNTVIRDKKKRSYSLFLPRYSTVRFDK